MCHRQQRVNDDGVFYDYSEQENLATPQHETLTIAQHDKLTGGQNAGVDVGADHISKPGVVGNISDGAELEGKEQPEPLPEVKDDVGIGDFNVNIDMGEIARENIDMRQQMARTQTLEDELARQQSSVWGEASSNATFTAMDKTSICLGRAVL